MIVFIQVNQLFTYRKYTHTLK